MTKDNFVTFDQWKKPKPKKSKEEILRQTELIMKCKFQKKMKS